ncbi:hypothetical protein HA520_20335 [Azotobacter chroococcum]|uniref:Uncharacterized protein n=1 Tax=Azotobacter chroococcum TaxID=353 RepID=A0AA44C8J8_9GAMM|nr:hypothetical protein [Azotobacter chroococcum]ASL27379.1 hypothetical protein ACG10_14655 [Azotobacter chroococcum]NHN79595.1 hypothetical protein [Azotobacter chroococcum]
MTSLYRIHPQPAFNFGGLVIDNFGGGGGASTGIELGLGRPADITATAGFTPAHWRDNQDTGIPGVSKTEVTRRELALADSIRAYASIGMKERQIRSKTVISTAILRKIAKRHRIAMAKARRKEAA